LQFVTLTQLSQPVATPVGVTTSFAFREMAPWENPVAGPVGRS
jgi:hypothetical protein